MAVITKDMTIRQVLELDDGCVPIFFSMGMHCVGCPSSSGESLEEAAAVHGYDPQLLVDQLNAYFKDK